MVKILLATLLIHASFSAKSQTDSIYYTPEILPSFPGGYDSLKSFIIENLNYPAGREDVEGTVYIQFTVSTDGTLSDITVIKGLCTECDKNAQDVFKKMPRWIPGKTNDTLTPIRMIFPVRFTLER